MQRHVFTTAILLILFFCLLAAGFKFLALIIALASLALLMILPESAFFPLYIIVLFLPTGLAPINIAGFQLQPIDVFLGFGCVYFSITHAKFAKSLWRGAFWDLIFWWILLAVCISLFKSYEILGFAGFKKVLVYSGRFVLFSISAYLVCEFIRKAGIESCLRVIFWMAFVLSLSGIIEKLLLSMGMIGTYKFIVASLGVRFDTGHADFLDKLSRTSGLIGSPETFGMTLSQILPLAFCYRFVPQSESTVVTTTQDGAIYKMRSFFMNPTYHTVFCDLSIAMGMVSIILSSTRLAFATMILVFVIFMIFSRLRVRLSLLMANLGLLFIAALFSAQKLWERFDDLFTGHSGNLEWRRSVWHAAKVIWEREPWTGHGFGGFEVAMERLFGHVVVAMKQSMMIRETGPYDTACSLYWQLLTDLGVFGLIPFVLLFLLVIFMAWKTMNQTSHPVEHNLCVVILACGIANVFAGFPNGSQFLIRGATFLLISMFWLQLAFLQVIRERQAQTHVVLAP